MNLLDHVFYWEEARKKLRRPEVWVYNLIKKCNCFKHVIVNWRYLFCKIIFFIVPQVWFLKPWRILKSRLNFRLFFFFFLSWINQRKKSNRLYSKNWYVRCICGYPSHLKFIILTNIFYLFIKPIKTLKYDFYH